MSFRGLLDMIDGGGAGRSGPRFQGGGLLSDIGNAVLRPYGYRGGARKYQETLPAPPTPPYAPVAQQDAVSSLPLPPFGAAPDPARRPVARPSPAAPVGTQDMTFEEFNRTLSPEYQDLPMDIKVRAFEIFLRGEI